MTWSYSRINSFDDCPYAWFLSYIKKLPRTQNFFSQYGLLMHHILQKYLSGKLQKRELIPFYIENFSEEITQRPKTADMRTKYFLQGLEYLKNISWKQVKILGVEQEIAYKIAGKPATGFVDLIENEDGIIITDHKSADLAGYSGRKKPTKNDLALDNYFRQHYLYSIAAFDLYGEYPKELRLNCFRNNSFISVPFDHVKFEATLEWASAKIDAITKNEDWTPRTDYFRCNFLCDMRENCEYHLMDRG